ncbi:uncharacterized protein B0I36DRAFT_319515 [Microdochium trichocladiopsis]|uniref:Uncharacterized protein n=1 Tax=Microdochium trichocladiopsis TaxID=1682393 RepID=A0A9P9BXE7_9PEZI|nr:uncharacterized protein B0I36DRAFT_319515 [Microdochium trichocladiopsis]KAH7036001.1 hypothetical protein B0I36DRAFT_319515 [Microdochium trichocladiopsis]
MATAAAPNAAMQAQPSISAPPVLAAALGFVVVVACVGAVVVLVDKEGVLVIPAGVDVCAAPAEDVYDVTTKSVVVGLTRSIP